VSSWTGLNDSCRRPGYSGYQTPQKVIVAMGNAAERHRVATELKRSEYKVIALSNCHDVLTVCRQSSLLDGLITDMELGYMGGLELARCASQYQLNLAVICLSCVQPRVHVTTQLAQNGWQWALKGPGFPEVVAQKLQTALTTLVAS